MTHSDNSRLPLQAFGRPLYSWQTHIMSYYNIPALSSISLLCAQLRGLKLEQWISRASLYVRCLLLISTEPCRFACAYNAAFSNTAKILHSIAVLLFCVFLFFFFSFSSYTSAWLSRIRVPYVRSFVCFKFVLPSFRHSYISLTLCSHTHFLILFSVFLFVCLYEFPYFRFTVPFHFHSGTPASSFEKLFGARHYCTIYSSRLTLTRDVILCILRAQSTYSTWQIARARRHTVPSITQISSNRFNDTYTNLMINRQAGLTTLCVITVSVTLYVINYIILSWWNVESIYLWK